MAYNIPDPTEKQIEYIKAIQAALGYPFDFEHSNRKQASAYITKHTKSWRAYQREQSKKEKSA